ncbi:carbohydrate ABC transporter substrate-binding protein [Candidatus Bipolaricaulota bacterium]|nr:carbohydrate ABC transporter substrate-binding protein [Candidatus Bipolaricaulota bacterium]
MTNSKTLIISLTILLALTPLISSATANAKANDKLELYHWWTAGGEKEAIDALFDLYNTVYPDIEIVENPVSGGGGGIMRSKIKTMIMAGNAPDTFQITYGSGMLGSWVEVLQPIDELWENFPVPEKVKEMGTIDGHQYGIPINIMRNNCLWYNKKLVDELNIDMPIKSQEDLFQAMEKAKEAGYIPYAIGAGSGQEFWIASQVFQSFLLAAPHGGPEYLEKLYSGKANPGEDEAIKEALTSIKKIIDSGYINSDYASLTWDQAADLLVEDKAVFYQMGDWVKGHFNAVGWESMEDFNYQATPGTQGMFSLHFDCFVLPQGAPNPKAAKKWLQMLKTVEAETVFNPIKGATPPRTDAFTDMYDEISQDILIDFRDPETVIVESAFAGPPSAWLDVFGRMFSNYFENPNVERGIKNFARAYNGINW